MHAWWNALRRWWSGGEKVDGVRELGRGEVARLPSFRKGSSLRLESGLVVVTTEGDRRDHVLEAGSELQVPGRGLVVAWAVEPSRLGFRRRSTRLSDWRTAAPRRMTAPPGRGDGVPRRIPAQPRER